MVSGLEFGAKGFFFLEFYCFVGQVRCGSLNPKPLNAKP